MNKTAREQTPDPLLGAAALKNAMPELEVASNGPVGFDNIPDAASERLASGEPGKLPSPKTVAQLLGEITWLMTQSPRHKSIPLGDLEWLIMPAILLKQFRMFYKAEQPVGVAVWALANDLVAKRIDAGDRRLTSVEWRSGSNMCIIDVVAPFGAEVEIREKIVDA